jgi:hypothetical protein
MADRIEQIALQLGASHILRSWGLTYACGAKRHENCQGQRFLVTGAGPTPAGTCTCECHGVSASTNDG